MRRIVKIPLVIALVVLDIVLILVAVVYLQFPISNAIKNHQAIRYHNACIEKAISTATSIEISSVSPVGSEGEFIRRVELTDRDKIKWLLERFKLPPQVKFSSPFYHMCRGNIKLTILYDSTEEHFMGFDHGWIMMPIVNTNIVYYEFSDGYKMYGPGSMEFKTGVCVELHEFLKELGFSEDEIGIER